MALAQPRSQQNQSVIGLFRALRWNPRRAAPRGRSTAGSWSSSNAASRAARCAPGFAAAARARTGATPAREPRDGRQRRTASSRREASCAATSDAARSCRRAPDPAARRSRGAARCRRRRCSPPIRRCAIWCAQAADPALIVVCRRRAGARVFPDRRVSARRRRRARQRERRPRWSTAPTEGQPRFRAAHCGALRRPAGDTSWSSPAPSRAWICSRAASSIPATPSSSIGRATSARSAASAPPARGSSAGTSRARTSTSSKS